MDKIALKEKAILEFTSEQHQTLVASATEPIRAIDPATNTEYIVVRAEVYERIKHLLSDDRSWLEGAYLASLEVFARDGWNDPRMDVYDALDPRKSS